MKKLLIILLTIIFPVTVYGQITQDQINQLSPLDQSLLQNALNLLNQNKGNSFIDSNTGLPQGISEQISTTVRPSIPKPEENFYIEVTSYSTNLNAANITWTVDGQNILSGLGERRVNLVAPESGKRMSITLTVRKVEGGILTKNFELTPADVDILYEADTYTPPFYKGAALFTNEAGLNFVAIPDFKRNGTSVSSGSLIYTWKIDGQVIESASGMGKDQFYYQGKVIQRPFTVTVNVTDPNSSLIARKDINIKEFRPNLVIYENNPLIGTVFEQAINGDFVLERKEIDFTAIPYFFSAEYSNDSNLSYEWFMNGKKVTTQANQNNITFRNDTGLSGQSLISVKLNHFNKIIQSSNSRLTLKFAENLSDFSF